jgi:hypothetical protein
MWVSYLKNTEICLHSPATVTAAHALKYPKWLWKLPLETMSDWVIVYFRACNNSESIYYSSSVYKDFLSKEQVYPPPKFYHGDETQLRTVFMIFFFPSSLTRVRSKQATVSAMFSADCFKTLWNGRGFWKSFKCCGEIKNGVQGWRLLVPQKFWLICDGILLVEMWYLIKPLSPGTRNCLLFAEGSIYRQTWEKRVHACSMECELESHRSGGHIVQVISDLPTTTETWGDG